MGKWQGDQAHPHLHLPQTKVACLICTACDGICAFETMQRETIEGDVPKY